MNRRRLQGAYLPYKKVSFGAWLIRFIEMTVKTIFRVGCIECGTCILDGTNHICPSRCPQGYRNGPCGGSTNGKCYVIDGRPCVWHLIYEKSKKKGKEDRLRENFPPIALETIGESIWLRLLMEVRRIGIKAFFADPQLIFQSLRPDWWNEGSIYHPPNYDDPASKLETALQSGEFVITCEINVPLIGSSKKLRELIGLVKGYVTAISFTSNPGSGPRPNSGDACQIAKEEGVDAIFQIAMRDTNRIYLQSQGLGAGLGGIPNVMVVGGDTPLKGPCPNSIGRLDVDPIHGTAILRIVREGRTLDNKEIKNPPKYFLMSVANPFSSEPWIEVLRGIKKINAGTQCFITNGVFSRWRFLRWYYEVLKSGMLNLGRVYIMAGVILIKSVDDLEKVSAIPGIIIPERVEKRIRNAGERVVEEGINLAVETINFLRKLPGISGVHIMTIGGTRYIPHIIERAGLCK